MILVSLLSQAFCPLAKLNDAICFHLFGYLVLNWNKRTVVNHWLEQERVTVSKQRSQGRDLKRE